MNKKPVRNQHMDNIKLFLLFNVALAHNLIPFKEQNEILPIVIKFIYLFHMPLFTYCTGMLVKNSKKSIWQYTKKLLVPYVVFQLFYVAVGAIMINFGIISYSTETMQLSLVEPSSPLYFLICMVVWRFIVVIFEKQHQKWCVFSLILFGTLISLDPNANTIVMPIFALLPFYYLGYISNYEFVEHLLDSLSKWKVLIGGGIYAGIVFLVPYEVILFRINIWDMDVRPITALGLKLLYYVAAIMGGLIVMKIIPRKKIENMTNKSANGMIIYIGSSFLAPYLYILLFNKLEILQTNVALNIIAIVIFSIIIIEVLSWNCWKKLYDFVFGRIT